MLILLACTVLRTCTCFPHGCSLQLEIGPSICGASQPTSQRSQTKLQVIAGPKAGEIIGRYCGRISWGVQATMQYLQSMSQNPASACVSLSLPAVAQLLQLDGGLSFAWLPQYCVQSTVRSSSSVEIRSQFPTRIATDLTSGLPGKTVSVCSNWSRSRTCVLCFSTGGAGCRTNILPF